MAIMNHLLEGADQRPSPNHSGVISPKFIVMHYTATWEVGSVIRTFSKRSSKVSAHVTVDTDGTIYQHVPFNIKAWHAGPSAFAGYRGLNYHSVGIEMVNPGYCRKTNNGIVDANGHTPPFHFSGNYLKEAHQRVGSGVYYWPEYTEAQLEAVERLSEQLIRAYDIIDIVSHEEIDLRGWKTDPGPAFPMKRFKKLLPDRGEDEVGYVVTATALNVRGGPGTEFAVRSMVRKGARVSVGDVRGDWMRIDDDGWVHGAYLRRV